MLNKNARSIVFRSGVRSPRKPIAVELGETSRVGEGKWQKCTECSAAWNAAYMYAADEPRLACMFRWVCW